MTYKQCLEQLKNEMQEAERKHKEAELMEDKVSRQLRGLFGEDPDLRILQKKRNAATVAFESLNKKIEVGGFKIDDEMPAGEGCQ